MASLQLAPKSKWENSAPSKILFFQKSNDSYKDLNGPNLIHEKCVIGLT